MSLLGIFIVALIMAFAFSPYRKNNPLGPLLILFFILMLSGFAAHYWVIPFGPRFWGVSWLPVLIMMFAFGLLFSSPPPGRRMKQAPDGEQQETNTAIGLFIWIVVSLLLAAVIIGMYHASSSTLV